MSNKLMIHGRLVAPGGSGPRGRGSLPPEVEFRGSENLVGTVHTEQEQYARDRHIVAAGIATAFLRMGARAVNAAAWQVDDEAALRFAGTFYEQRLRRHETFGNAVHRARVETYEAFPASNTWGAYQCVTATPPIAYSPTRTKGPGSSITTSIPQWSSFTVSARGNQNTIRQPQSAIGNRPPSLCLERPDALQYPFHAQPQDRMTMASESPAYPPPRRLSFPAAEAVQQWLPLLWDAFHLIDQGGADQTFDATLPCYGINTRPERRKTIKTGALHGVARILRECEWQTRATKMEVFGAMQPYSTLLRP